MQDKQDKQNKQTPTREDFEFAIEDIKEMMYEHRYALRWFTRGMRIFWLGVILAFIAFVVVIPLNIQVLQSLFETIGFVAAGVTLFVGIVLFAFFITLEPIRYHQKHVRENKRLLERLLQRLAYLDEQALRHLTPEQYMHQIPGLIASYRKQADQYRRWFTVIQIVVILLSAIITSLSGGWLDRYLAVPWIIPVFSALISIFTSLTLFFKWREKGTNLQQTADNMDWEHMACTLSIGAYEGIANKEDRLTMFAKRAEALRKEQQQRQLQLEQSSHAEQKALQSNT